MPSSSSLAFILAVGLDTILPALICVYAAHWAFSIRRALASPLYRSRALGEAFVCIAFVVFPISNTLSDSSLAGNEAVSLATTVIGIVVLLCVFTFIDTTLPIMRRSDPLLRSILHWDKIRFILWADMGAAVLYLLVSAFDPASMTGLVSAIGYPIILSPVIVGAVALLVGVRRSRDPVLRESLKWFVGFLAFLLSNAVLLGVATAVGISNYDISFSYPALLGVPAAVLFGYCLYRSARSLAPISELSSVQPNSKSKTSAGMSRLQEA